VVCAAKQSGANAARSSDPTGCSSLRRQQRFRIAIFDSPP
jgi:hypothetical protein